jgi:hypothetical protein
VRISVGGEAFRVRVFAPTTLSAGQRGAVRVQLGRAARRALAGHGATVAFDVAIRSGRQSVQRRLRVTLGRR